MRTYARQRGYVLLLTVLVLAMCASIAAVAVRRSAAAALRARRTLSDLQKRYGVVSCRRVAVARAHRLLAPDGPDDPGRSDWRGRVRLGGVEFALRLADEQAKANVNALRARRPPSTARAHLRDLLDGCPGVRLAADRPTAPDGKPERLVSYDQFLLYEDVEALLGRVDAVGRDAAADRVTCWGDGRVNLRKADERVVRVALAGRLTADEIGRLLAARKTAPGASCAALLAALELPDKRRREILTLVADRSRTFSVQVRTADPRGAERTLFVADASAAGGATRCFAW